MVVEQACGKSQQLPPRSDVSTKPLNLDSFDRLTRITYTRVMDFFSNQINIYAFIRKYVNAWQNNLRKGKIINHILLYLTQPLSVFWHDFYDHILF